MYVALVNPELIAFLTAYKTISIAFGLASP